MKKIRFVSLCFAALICLASCQKDVQPTNTNTGQQQNYPVTAVASDWTAASSLTWTDPATTSDVFLHADWSASELTEEVINNGAVLVFAKTNDDEEPKQLPALFERVNNEASDVYRSVASPQNIQLAHTSYVNGSYATPSVNNTISFRFIIIESVPPANGRINISAEQDFQRYRMMSYNELTAELGISR